MIFDGAVPSLALHLLFFRPCARVTKDGRLLSAEKLKRSLVLDNSKADPDDHICILRAVNAAGSVQIPKW
jgi:hypothetical protein